LASGGAASENPARSSGGPGALGPSAAAGTAPQLGANEAGKSRSTPGPPQRHMPSYDRTNLLGAIRQIPLSSSIDVASAAGTAGPAGPMPDAGWRGRCGVAIVAPASVAVDRIGLEGYTGCAFVY